MNQASSVIHIALRSESIQVPLDELNTVAAALTKQLARDFAPIWNIHATVSAFINKSAVTPNYWPVTVKDQIDAPGAAGYHADSHNQPYSLIQYSPDWSVTASHEVLEMVGDPFGNRLVAGIIKSERVRVLREMCDPCERFTYAIDGVNVSDFLLPSYYGPTIPGTRYSFLNALKAPLTVAKGGYLSFVTAQDQWKQITWFNGTRPVTRTLQARTGGGSLREWIDSQVREMK